MVVALADAVFDDDYVIACVVVDVAVVVFIAVHAGDAGFSAVVHVDAKYLSNLWTDVVSFVFF